MACSWSSWRTSLALVALLLGLGCGPQAPPPAAPQQPTYRSMPEAFRRTYSEAEFERMLRGEVVIPERAGGPATDVPADPEFSTATPRATLLSFLLCYQRRDFVRMLQLIPDRYRSNMTAESLERQFSEPETEEMMDKLADGADGPIDERGDEATLRYGGRYELQLIREGGGWKIKDID
jgi:hypothetical protein